LAVPQYDTEQLILQIKEDCAVPTSQLTYEDTDFCRLATNRMQNIVVPLVMSTREEYFVDYEDFLAPSTGILTIPKKAVGEKLRSVCFVSQPNPLVLINLPRLDLDQVAGVTCGRFMTYIGYYVQDDKIMLYPNTGVQANNTIRLYYYRRTLNLAAPQEYGQVISVDANTNSMVLDYIPSTWVAGTKLNSVSSTPSFGVTNELITIVSVSNPTLFVDSVAGIVVGDYISFEGYSAVPQIPLECHAYLAQLTAAKCLQGLGNREGMEAAMKDAEEMKQAMLVMISNRVDGSAKKVIDPNGGLRLFSGIGLWGMNRGRGRW
jgi:hypothetical protein